MPEIFKRFFHRVGQQDAKVIVTTDSPAPVEIVPPAPKPELIDVEKHRFRFYPGFEEFAALWNNHAISPARLGLQQEIHLTQLKADKLPNESVTLQEEVERQKVEQQRRREIYDARKDLPNKEKLAPLKSANRRVGKALQALDKVSRQEQRIRSEADTLLKMKEASLIGLDHEFGLGLNEDMLKFYCAERLSNNQDAFDSFLLRYCEKELSVREQRSVLWRINSGFFNLSNYFSNTGEEVIYEERKASADRTTNRQLGKRAELLRKELGYK